MEGFRFEIVRYVLADLGLGAWITVKITVIAFLLALVLGLVVGTARYRSRRWRAWLSPYVEIFRGTPLLIQLFFLYYGLPTIGVNMSSMVAACLGLGLNGGAYVSEIIRGGLAGVDKGQEEAAVSTGLGSIQVLRHVILPQAMRTSVPPLMNAFSSLLKESSLVSVLAITELTRVGQLVYTRTFRPFEIYLTVGVIYFLVTYAVSRLSSRVETALGVSDPR